MVGVLHLKSVLNRSNLCRLVHLPRCLHCLIAAFWIGQPLQQADLDKTQLEKML